MILCDTNILIEFYKQRSQVMLELREIGSHALAISLITRAELYYGALNKRELRQIERHLSTITEYPITVAVSRRFAQLVTDYSLSHKLHLADAFIAATAIENNLPLYTLI